MTVLTLGDAGADSVIRKALAMGADEAVVLSDPAFAESDGFATARILAQAIQKLGKYDLILCGRQAADWDQGIVGSALAEFLGIPVVTRAKAVEAADGLAESGIRARVLDVHTLKPIDREAVEACARETRGIITVEEHNIIGGLGSAVVETLAEEPGCPVVRIGIPDIFPVIGPTFELRRHLCLTAAAIMEKARRLLTGAKNR